MKKLILAFILAMTVNLSLAGHWTPIQGFQNTMTVNGIIKINGVEQFSSSLEVGAFCGDECRGSELAMFFPPTGQYLVPISIAGNESGDVISFRLYDHSQNMEIEGECETMTFVVDAMIGVPGNWQIFDFLTSSEPTKHWTPLQGFQNTMTVNGIIKINGVEQFSSMLEIGAFCGDECRGSELAMFFPPTGQYLVPISIAGNESGDVISFRLYDHSQNKEIEGECETMTFVVDAMIGVPGNWQIFDFQTSSEPTKHWTPLQGFQNTMTVNGIIKINGVEQFSSMLEIGAFCGDECRGSELAMFFPPTGQYLVPISIAGNESGDVISFRLYDHSQNMEIEGECETMTFVVDAMIGVPGNWQIFDFLTSTGAFVFIGSETNHNWSVPDNWSTGSLPTAEDDVVIDAYCELNESATAASLSVNAGKSIAVKNGMTLTVTGTLVTADATQLVVKDGGQLVHSVENVLATLQKDIIGYTGEKDRYYLIANPTANPAVANLNANEYDLFTFDPTHELEWVYQPEPTITQNVGNLYANSGDVTLGFAGVLIPAGEETIGLAYYNGTGSGREYPGFNLVGNPFACNAYVSGNYYRMNNTEFIAATGEPIAPCEGIFVEATGVGQSITFTTTAPDMEANIEITLSQGRGGIIDRAILSFGNSYNLHKFMMDESNTQLYIPQDGEKYAAFTMENAIGEMPINFKAAQNGTYTITVNVENASYLHLIDNLTGTDTDLLAISSKGLGSYTFTALTTDYASRFKLVFSMTGIGENVADTSFAYLSNGNLVVTDAGPGNTLQIIDALGRVVTNEKLGGNSTIGIQDLKAGVYVLRLINGEKIMIQKIVKD